MVTGVTLSRWTLSYIATALVFLLLAEISMVAGFGYPVTGLRAPQTLFVVHCVTIGWLSLLMLGALMQFVPVLVVTPLHSNTLPLPALLLIATGLVALLAGFLQLAGYLPPVRHCFLAASVLLGSGFAVALWTLVRTLVRARPLSLASRFVGVGLVCLAFTVAMGILFVLGLGGHVRSLLLAELWVRGLPLHVVAGLGGWLTFTAIGVSHRLLAMFMLSPELDGRPTHWTFRTGTLALAVLMGGGVAAIAWHAGLAWVLGVAGMAGIACLLLYARDIRQLYGKRLRKVIELNSRMAAVSLAQLAIAAAACVLAALAGQLGRWSGVLVFLIGFGWLSGLGLAKLYKIIAFVTWLECYGPVLGKAPTPRVQDLVTEARAIKWFWLYFGAVDVAAVCLGAGLVVPFRVAAAAMAVATLGIVAELLRIRRLVDVKEDMRLPAGTHRPRLFRALVADRQ